MLICLGARKLFCSDVAHLKNEELTIVNNALYNCAAETNFDRFGFAVITGRSKQGPCNLGAVPKQAKTFFPRIPLVSTIKQCPDFKGFFASVVLRTNQEPNRAARNKTVSVAEFGKVQLLQSDGLAETSRPGTCESKHEVPLLRSDTSFTLQWVGEAFE